MGTSRRRRKIPRIPHLKTRHLSVFTQHSNHLPTKEPQHPPQHPYTIYEASRPIMPRQQETRWPPVHTLAPLPNTIYLKPVAWQASLQAMDQVHQQDKPSR